MYEKELEQIKKILGENRHGMSILDISAQIGVNRNSVAKYMDVLSISGYVDMKKVGPTKLYFLSNKLPVSALLDLSNQAVVSFDSNGRITQSNKLAEKWFGNKIKSLLKVNNEYSHSGKLYSVKKVKSTYDDGSKGITLIMEDITNEMKVKEELELLKRAVEASSSGVTIADARLEDMPLIYVNPAFEQMTGYKSSEVLGKNCRFLQGPKKDQPELVIVRDALEKGKDCRVILRNFTKKGKLFLNELRLSPVKKNGKVTHFVGIQTKVD